jgi:hypothetical protein
MAQVFRLSGLECSDCDRLDCNIIDVCQEEFSASVFRVEIALANPVYRSR